MSVATKSRKKKTDTTDSVIASLDAHDADVRAAELRHVRIDAPRRIPLARLVRHGDNREPTPEAIAAMAESLAAHGQLEPIVVRDLGDGSRWQVLSGETRWLAARKLDWTDIEVRAATECGDSAALQLMAAANAQRRDLTTAQRARLIKRLCEPTADGGGGLTRAAAGALYGITASAASNLVRLLDAPSEWLDRIDHPERPVYQATVREIAKITDCPAALAALDERWRSEDAWDWESDREGQVQLVRTEAAECSRPMDDGASWYSPGHGQRLQWRAKYAAGRESDLGVVDLPVGEDGAMAPCATNCELWESLAAEDSRQSSPVIASDAADDTDDEPSPPRDDAARREKSAEQLDRWIADEWRPLMLRLAIAGSLPARPDIASRLAPWLLCWARADYRRSPGDYMVRALTSGPASRVIPGEASGAKCRDKLISHEGEAGLAHVLSRLAQEILWADEPLRESGHLADIAYDDLVAWARLVSSEDVLVRAWLDGAVDGTDERGMIARFLARHTVEQLRAYEWVADPPPRKSDLIDRILAAHRPGAPLAPPACCELPREKRKRGAR